MCLGRNFQSSHAFDPAEREGTDCSRKEHGDPVLLTKTSQGKRATSFFHRFYQATGSSAPDLSRERHPHAPLIFISLHGTLHRVLLKRFKRIPVDYSLSFRKERNVIISYLETPNYFPILFPHATTSSISFYCSPLKSILFTSWALHKCWSASYPKIRVQCCHTRSAGERGRLRGQELAQGRTEIGPLGAWTQISSRAGPLTSLI